MLRERVLTKSPTVNVMIEAAMKAGRSLVKDFGEIEKLQVSRKGPANFVSNADKKAEKIIHMTLEKARPGFSFLMEESGATPGEDGDNLWIVDPLDGTTNFLHGLPGFCVSIAHAYKGEVMHGVIYDPLLDEIFWAERDGGAFMNHERLVVAGRTKVEESLFLTGYHRSAIEGGRERFFRRIHTLYDQVGIVRMMGSSALSLAYTAAGRADAYFEEDLKPWDVAAGILLVREAKGVVSEISGGDNVLYGPSILAANVSLQENLLKVL